MVSHVEDVEILPAVVVDEELEQKRKKKKKRDDSEDQNKPKTALDIQREMTKWARRQEKVKMTFKQPEASQPTSNPSNVNSTKVAQLAGDINPKMLQKIQKTWNEDDDEEDVQQDSVLPHRMRSVGLPLNCHSVGQNSGLSTSSRSNNEPTLHGTVDERRPFDESVFIDRSKISCMLCRRQFANLETLNKHVQMSDLHKANIAAKIKEVEKNDPANTQNSASQYRDRAKERRQIHGYDPSGLAPEQLATNEVRDTEVEAAYKARVPLDDSNIGNRMLKSMGWSEGSGLGRNQQGIVNPVTAEQRIQGAGLGASGSKLIYGATRRDRLKQAAIQRFNDLPD